MAEPHKHASFDLSYGFDFPPEEEPFVTEPSIVDRVAAMENPELEQRIRRYDRVQRIYATLRDRILARKLTIPK